MFGLYHFLITGVLLRASWYSASLVWLRYEMAPSGALIQLSGDLSFVWVLSTNCVWSSCSSRYGFSQFCSLYGQCWASLPGLTLFCPALWAKYIVPPSTDLKKDLPNVYWSETQLMIRSHRERTQSKGHSTYCMALYTNSLETWAHIFKLQFCNCLTFVCIILPPPPPPPPSLLIPCS